MRMKDINSHIKGGKMHLKSFPGAKASKLYHYIKPTLEEYKYDCAIIHVVSMTLSGIKMILI